MKKKKKILYKRVTKWKKEPDKGGICGGIIFILFSLGMISLSGVEEKQVMILTFIFTLMFVFGIRLTLKSRGEGKEEYYTRRRLN